MALLFFFAGLFTVVCTIRKPTFFWEHYRSRSLRRVIGDTRDQVLHLKMGLNGVAPAETSSPVYRQEGSGVSA